MPYRASVIMPCFNKGRFLSEAVASVIRGQTLGVELVVIDDGSTDPETLTEIGKLHGTGITVIRQENRGLAGARNAGVRASQAEYIFPLDADDRLRPGWIDRGIAILDKDPRVGVVYGDAQLFGRRNGRDHVGPFDSDLLLNQNFIHCSALYRRIIWEQNSGYDGTMPVQGYEDWDFWISTFERGWEFHYLPEILFEYRQSDESMLSRATASLQAVQEFVGAKHGVLYRQKYVSKLGEISQMRLSIRWTLRNLKRLVEERATLKLKSIVPSSDGAEVVRGLQTDQNK